MSWLDVFTGPVLANIIGGTAFQAVTMGSLFLITILVILLLSARIDLDFAFIIVSPAIIVASFAGLLPPLAFGIIVLLLALFFTGVLLVIAK